MRPPSSTGTVTDVLMPRKVRHRKTHRGRTGGPAKGGTEVVFGEYGIQALEPGWITARQIDVEDVVDRGGGGVAPSPRGERC